VIRAGEGSARLVAATTCQRVGACFSESARRLVEAIGNASQATNCPTFMSEGSSGAMRLTSHDPRKPAEEQYFGGPSLGEDLHASVHCRSPLEGRLGIAHQAVQVREVGCRHGEDLSVPVHSPPKKFGLPRGRCDVESPAIAVAADEQIEYTGFRRHHGERSIWLLHVPGERPAEHETQDTSLLLAQSVRASA